MGKRIVLFSDGTGNSSAKAQKTNVWRLFQALDQSQDDQIAKYDDGVGTSSNKYLAALGGAFGWGLKRNVLDLYKFVCRNYARGDDIYGFGFSRGSFTIRVLVDFIATEGLVTFRSAEELNRNAAAAYRHYRSKNFPSWSPLVIVMRWVRDTILWAKDRIKGYRTYKQIAAHTKAAGRTKIPIRFLGLWDTVEAYGMPLEELKRGIDWVLWPMLFGDLILSPRVQRACHALSLDDERTTFHPLLWDEVAEADMVTKKLVKPGRITQVWFAGAHSNVGGGYPEDQLSLVALDWMISEATANDLHLDQSTVKQVAVTKSPYARLYDSRAGLGSYYRYAPRQIWVRRDAQETRILPIVHWSVVMRMAYGSDQYSPITLPHEFWVLAPDGELLPMEGAPLTLKVDATKKREPSAPHAAKTGTAITDDKAKLVTAIAKLSRPDREAIRLVWDTVFWRRCVYFLTVGLTCVLVAYPWLGGLFTKVIHRVLGSMPIVGADLDHKWQTALDQLDHGSRGPITNLVDAMSGFIPSYLEPWVKVLKDYPIEFSIIAAAIIVSVAGSSILQARIHDRARLAWHKELQGDYTDWLAESQTGWRNGVLASFVIAIVFVIAAFDFGWSGLIKLELGIVASTLLVLLALRSFGKRPASHSGGAPIQGTFALSLARSLRNNSILQSVYKWLFKKTIPIAFALLLVVAGILGANRVIFDAFSAAGYYCHSTLEPDARKREATGSKAGFNNDQMCWATGLVLEEGKRYRITLTTPGDWFDRTTRADVAGFPADNLRHIGATPLKRWWARNWFTPIARIGEIGNDEYALVPADSLDDYTYPACPEVERVTNENDVRAKIREDVARKLLTCAPTPVERKTVTSVIKARSTGELFLYLNDAVMMWPGRSDQFYSNNSGTGSISVERISMPD